MHLLGVLGIVIAYLTNKGHTQLVQTINRIIDNDLQKNPDVDLPTLDMITRQGYRSESHKVTTEDGYILTLHRIPGDADSIPILLQHGFLESSADWVIPGKGRGLAYVLSDQGYDIWLSNSRGNTYSRAHHTLPIDDPQYWNFTYHEMGVYDLPAIITYITNIKQKTLVYIGHSMGTTMSYIMGSERPDIAKKVHLLFSLAPAGYVSHMKSPLRLIAPFRSEIKNILELVGFNEFLPSDFFVKTLAKYGCNLIIVEQEICKNILFTLWGFDSEQFNNTLLPVILSHYPAGASTKTLAHFGQYIQSGRFEKYDYGTKNNYIIYNSPIPPAYNLTKMEIPAVFFYADNDWLVAPEDAQATWEQIQNKVELIKVEFPKFNHLDFLWGIDAPSLVYNKLISIIKRYKSKPLDNYSSDYDFYK